MSMNRPALEVTTLKPQNPRRTECFVQTQPMARLSGLGSSFHHCIRYILSHTKLWAPASSRCQRCPSGKPPQVPLCSFGPAAPFALIFNLHKMMNNYSVFFFLQILLLLLMNRAALVMTRSPSQRLGSFHVCRFIKKPSLQPELLVQTLVCDSISKCGSPPVWVPKLQCQNPLTLCFVCPLDSSFKPAVSA